MRTTTSWCRPRKTRKRRWAFRIPLATADALELDRWSERMSRQNVDHYMRFRDQVKTADAGQKRLKLVSKED